MRLYMKLFYGVSKRLLLISLGLLAAAFFAQGAKADSLDFSCGSGACTGTVVAVGVNLSTSGIELTSNSESDPFNLTFNTATNSIQIAELTDPTDVFTGTITGFGATNATGFENLDLSAVWNTLPSDVNGTVGVTPFSFILSIGHTGQALSVDVPISTSTPVSTPEPSTLVLLGAALVSLGLLLKFKRPVLA